MTDMAPASFGSGSAARVAIGGPVAATRLRFDRAADKAGDAICEAVLTAS